MKIDDVDELTRDMMRISKQMSSWPSPSTDCEEDFKTISEAGLASLDADTTMCEAEID